MLKPSISYGVKKNRWEVSACYTFEDYGVKICFPKGFVTDLASIPRLLWLLIAPYELGILPPLVHDGLYKYQGKNLRKDVDRKTADRIFLSLMENEDVVLWKRRLAYRAVRLFGWIRWHRLI